MDSSALVKAFLAEEGSEAVDDVLSGPDPAATSRIAYVECHAAFARGRREGRLSERQTSDARRMFDRHWPDLLAVELDVSLTERAALLVHDQALRAADAIHLASAEVLAGAEPGGVRFACWDARLWEAARAIGFSVVPGSGPGTPATPS